MYIICIYRVDFIEFSKTNKSLYIKVFVCAWCVCVCMVKKKIKSRKQNKQSREY